MSVNRCCVRLQQCALSLRAGALVDKAGALVDRAGALVDRAGALVDRSGMESCSCSAVSGGSAQIVRAYHRVNSARLISPAACR